MAKIKPVRVVKTQYGTYSLHYITPDGRRRRLSVGPVLQVAESMRIRFIDWLLEGKDPEREMERAKQEEREKSITLRELYPVFLERHGRQQSARMIERYEIFFKNISRCPELVDIPIDRISKSLMFDYMNARQKTEYVTPSTANREAAFIRGMLSRAVEWDILMSNPLQGLKLLKEPEKRRVRLTQEQAAALLDSLPHPLDEIVELAIYTGFRKENILGLRIEQIRMDDLLETGEVDLVIKGGRQEVFPLGKPAVAVLKRAIGNRNTGYVFINPDTGTRYYSINRTYARAVDRLGLRVGESRLRFHDLRHVFATWLHQSGVSLDALRPLLGHRDRDTTDRYAYLDRMDMGKVLNIMPRIRRKKDLDELTPRSNSRRGFGKNWQDLVVDHWPTLSGNHVTP